MKDCKSCYCSTYCPVDKEKDVLRVCDLAISDVKVGLRIRSLIDPNHIATVVEIDERDDNYAWIKWDGTDSITSGFYGNDCACEVVLE